MSTPAPRILYCHCQYAQVVPKEVKEEVLRQLCQSGVSFEAVADLCEMSARADAGLQRLAADGSVKIAACFPRAVKWLFHQANAPLNLDTTEVLNMRTGTAAETVEGLLSPAISPNLPKGKITAPHPELPTEISAESPAAV
jgi:hypothetical protein